MSPKDERYQIGEVAKANETSIDTIRYYEKLGLLEKPTRSVGGFRLYSKEAIEKLRFIKKAQSLGLVLSEIKGIMRCSEEGLKPCCDLVRRLFTKKIDEFESKIKELQRMKKDLETLLSEWVSPKEARKRSYAVCPQIEREPKKTRRKIKWNRLRKRRSVLPVGHALKSPFMEKKSILAKKATSSVSRSRNGMTWFGRFATVN